MADKLDLSPWIAKEAETIYNAEIRTIDTFYSSLADCRNVKRIILRAESTLDAAVQLQVIGNRVNLTDKATEIGPAVDCDANGNASMGLAFDDWQPYVGVKITTTVAPTTGALIIYALVQE